VLRWLVCQLLGSAAGTFSINKFQIDLKSQGIAVGKDTLHSYLSHLDGHEERNRSLPPTPIGRQTPRQCTMPS
jgi:hypothetical protein